MALRQRIDEARGAIPAAWPGDGYQPGAVAYLSVSGSILPPLRRVIRNDGKHEYAGILPLVLRTPLAGMVYEVQLEAAGQIAAAFPERREHMFRGVTISHPNLPTLPSGYRDGSYFHQPINIPIRAVA